MPLPAGIGETGVGEIRTAADMLSSGEAGKPKKRYPLHIFRQGVLVEHPEYGAGEIIALSGNGRKRTATVRFHNDSEERKFVLAHTPLAPLSDEA